MASTGSGIEIDSLQPPSARRELLRRQRQDAARRVDATTGLVRSDVAVPAGGCCVCGTRASQEQFVKEGFRFVTCTECGLWYVDPRLNEEETRRLYSEGGRAHFQFHHFYLPSAAYRQAKLYPRRLDAIEARLGAVGSLLDVGSGTGHFLQCAQRRGWRVYGVELAAYAARHAREQLGLDTVRCLDLAETGTGDFDGPVDAVTLWDVIEHVSDPRSLVRKTRELLRPGGMVFVHTPQADCFERTVLGADMINFAGDFHPVCYTKNSLRRLIEDAGFVVEDLFTFGLDIAHIVEVYERQDRTEPLEFLRAYGDHLQEMIDRAGQGCYLACYARRPAGS